MRFSGELISYFDTCADFPSDLQKYLHLVVFSPCAFCHEWIRLLLERAINCRQPILSAPQLSNRSQLIQRIELDILTHLPSHSVCCIFQMEMVKGNESSMQS